MPGAFTQTCTNDHLPSLTRNAGALFKNGIDEIICIVVNDVHVAKAWGEATGATKGGINPEGNDSLARLPTYNPYEETPQTRNKPKPQRPRPQPTTTPNATARATRQPAAETYAWLIPTWRNA